MKVLGKTSRSRINHSGLKLILMKYLQNWEYFIVKRLNINFSRILLKWKGENQFKLRWKYSREIRELNSTSGMWIALIRHCPGRPELNVSGTFTIREYAL